MAVQMQQFCGKYRCGKKGVLKWDCPESTQRGADVPFRLALHVEVNPRGRQLLSSISVEIKEYTSASIQSLEVRKCNGKDGTVSNQSSVFRRE